jgi:Zn-dependent protease with chaperone function
VKEIAHHAHREVAFMKNRFVTYAVAGLIIFAVIGAFSSLITNPMAVLKGLAFMIVTVAVILLLVKLFYKPSQGKREQRAFIKAAKRSKKGKGNRTSMKMKSKPAQKQSSVTSFKKMRIRKKSNSNPNLTVIEGKKGKKKNRASL